MAVDSRIEWSEEPRKNGTRIVGTLSCDTCGNEFSRESFATTKEALWKIKETISDEISQHKH